ncbi:hypothetical protein AVEN_142604-1 [Araneus ventricosus]|uniref:Uncharacterized protein n=1 Tax=Araneus ventricosus TaxID=182803 RepID=A0A4Y2G9T6_ARAVE|nr:hypothetical protein AVEN_142604-1 [Araneus ventricosus]
MKKMLFLPRRDKCVYPVHATDYSSSRSIKILRKFVRVIIMPIHLHSRSCPPRSADHVPRGANSKATPVPQFGTFCIGFVVMEIEHTLNNSHNMNNTPLTNCI